MDKATYRVVNSLGKTTGFIVRQDGTEVYLKYFGVMKNIEYIQNLKITSNGVIRSRIGRLKSISIQDVNKKIYDGMCKDNPLARDVQHKLYKWKNKQSDLVLLLSGARQIGKTTELLKFAYSNYEQIVYINLANPNIMNDFVNLVLGDNLFYGMQNFCKKNQLEKFENSDKTILIIDEIQESNQIYNSIRELQSGLRCNIAVTGSYLGKTLKQEYFKPVGNIFEIEMTSLSFKEFARANGLENLLDTISIFGKSQKDDYVKLTNLYKTYIQIGGYPAVVREYFKSKDISECYELIAQIIRRFTEESSSYFKNDRCLSVFNNVYRAAFINMAKEKKGTAAKNIQDITEFTRSDTLSHVNRAEVTQAVNWLVYSKILGICDLYNKGNTMDAMPSRRFYFMDCGIASYIAKQTAIDKATVNGVIAENFVYDELYRACQEKKIDEPNPCCSVYNNYELDFMVTSSNGTKIGIEVKSNSSDKHPSIDLYLQKKLIDKAYVAQITKGGKGNTCNTIPIYTVGCRFPYDDE